MQFQFILFEIRAQRCLLSGNDRHVCVLGSARFNTPMFQVSHLRAIPFKRVPGGPDRKKC